MAAALRSLFLNALLSTKVVLLYFTAMPKSPTKLTEAAKKKIIMALEHDANVTQACRFAGIHRQTLYDHWNLHPEFKQDCMIAKEWAMFSIQMPMMKQAKKNGFLALKILERRKRNLFALKMETENNENVNYNFGFGKKTIHDEKVANQKADDNLAKKDAEEFLNS